MPGLVAGDEFGASVDALGDMDGDGDQDLIAVTLRENSVRVWLASTGCDGNATRDCCATGSSWNGTGCVQCAQGTYSDGEHNSSACLPCPTGCDVKGLWKNGRTVVPRTCLNVTGCSSRDVSIAKCVCKSNSVRNSNTHACTDCPAGMNQSSEITRKVDSLGNYTRWELQQGVCKVKSQDDCLRFQTVLAAHGFLSCPIPILNRIRVV